MSRLALPLTLAAVCAAASWPAHAQGDPRSGAQSFRACVACHSITPGQHMTGPSLAGVVGRKAGTMADFPRYSAALKKSGVVWNDETLDRWFADPQAVVPGTSMIFPGVKDARARADLIAYLRAPAAADTRQDGGDGMAMPRGGQERPDLKTLGPDAQLASLRYCGDTYFVTVASGRSQPIWENNLRFKTDSSDRGPRKGHPVLIPAGMMGDRASAVFADPSEIGAFVERRC